MSKGPNIIQNLFVHATKAAIASERQQAKNKLSDAECRHAKLFVRRELIEGKRVTYEDITEFINTMRDENDQVSLGCVYYNRDKINISSDSTRKNWPAQISS